MQKFHLVDTAGNPLEERFHQATRRLEGHFLSKLPAIGDEAIINNCVEETARKEPQSFFSASLYKCCKQPTPGSLPHQIRAECHE